MAMRCDSVKATHWLGGLCELIFLIFRRRQIAVDSAEDQKIACSKHALPNLLLYMELKYSATDLLEVGGTSENCIHNTL